MGTIDISNNLTDKALYIRIKVEHPLWSEEMVLGEIKRLKSEAINEWLMELINKKD